MAKRSSGLLPRFVTARVQTALRDTPVVLVNGPRQCGKTTLVRELIPGEREYVTLDDETALQAARADPVGFIRRLDRAAIDEVQKAPQLLPAIKSAVDIDRRPGRFLLTGSANVLTLPRVAESLAGRVEVITLLPLSRAEISATRPAFLANAFKGQSTKSERLETHELLSMVLGGGYPEMLLRDDVERRQAWARNYVKAVLDRDVRDIAEVERIDRLPRLLRALARSAGQLVNFTQLGGQIGLDDKTARRYLGILEQLFLVHRVEPWFRNRLNRIVKTPKLQFLDSGLLAAISGASPAAIAQDRTQLGALLETFVFAEIARQVSWQTRPLALHYFRDKDKNEVDIIVESDAGDIVALEVKAAATATTSDFKALRRLAEAAGAAFKFGAVVYDGTAAVPFGDRLFALPVASLWS